MAAPAGTAFTIEFDVTADGVQHNVAIVTTGSGPVQALFVGDLVTGPDTAIYEVDPIEAGIYTFRCDVHPQAMFGQFVVE